MFHMPQETLKVIEQVKQHGQTMLELFNDQQADTGELASRAVVMATVVEAIEGIVPAFIYEQYGEFFSAFSAFCRQCGDQDFLRMNRDEMISSLGLFGECMDDLKSNVSQTKRCPCCGHSVIYNPLSDYCCLDCGASDRDRLIVSFLKKEGLGEASEGTRVLQIAPAASVSGWILRKCPHIKYETTDLYMSNVTYPSDIMNMEMIADETYDVIICSHVPEHVWDDRKALREMKRILKPEGKIVLLVPIDLKASAIDEARGRLEEQLYVHSLGRDYFGDDIFTQCALSDSSTLYVLTKSQTVPLNMAEETVIDEKLCREGPLVSVILPCYNHERFVAEAIESVIHQSYKNIEIIVADDGSTDNTARIMKKYSSYFTKELYLTENTGGEVYYQLKQYARGKYIALMHSDDVWEKDKLALQVAYMEQHADCGVCLSWCLFTDEELAEYDNCTFIQANRSSREWMHFFWKYGNALCNPSSLRRRELDLKLKRLPVRQLTDFFTWMDVVQDTSIYVIPKVLVRMRWYQKNGQHNTSYPTEENFRRHMVEEGIGWLSVIRDMEADFFKGAFGSEMRNPAAETEEEIKCEKYFLMLGHANPLVQNSAMCYLQEIYDDVWECMEKEYHYTRNDYAADLVNKGVIQQLFLKEACRS